MKQYPHLAARVFNVPLLMHPAKLDAIIGGLGDRLIGVDAGTLEHTPAIAPGMFSTKKGPRNDDRGYQVVDGVAVINISGVLVHRTRMDTMSSYLLGYNTLAADLEHAMNNPDVHAVLQVYDTPGGEVQGAFEYASRVLDARGKKPLWAVADGMSASAGYLGGSAADRLYVTGTGYAGSIGVVMRHVDVSGAMAQDGIRVTHIYAGDHKVDGNQFEPLPAAVRADFQSEIDALYADFVQAVAKQRGMSAEAVIATQAQTYRGAAAVSAGLADGVSTTDALIAQLAGMRRKKIIGLPARNTANPKGAKPMDGNPEMAGLEQPAAATAETFTAADLDRARAEGHAAGAAAERERIQAVRESSFAGHEALIEKLMFDGKTTGPEAAVQVLKAEQSARARHAADLAADLPDPLASDATDGMAPAASASAAAKITAAQIDAKKAEYARNGKTLSGSQALAILKTEASNG